MQIGTRLGFLSWLMPKKKETDLAPPSFPWCLIVIHSRRPSLERPSFALPAHFISTSAGMQRRALEENLKANTYW